MESWRQTNKFKFFVVFALAAAFFLGGTIVQTQAAQDTIKQIERKISKIKRDIVTSPSRAEKDWLQTNDELTKLEQTSPGDGKLAALRKKLNQLGQKLEKRLKRPIGGSAPAAPQKKVVSKKSDSSGLPSSVVSGLKRVNSSLNEVEKALGKNRLQTAKTKLKTAQKAMNEVKNRYGKKIPAGNPEMKTTEDRLAAVNQQVEQAKSSSDAASAAEGAQEEHKKTQSKEWINKFSKFQDPKSSSYLLMGSSFNNASEDVQKRCRQAYDRANKLMAEYKNTEFPYGKTQELKSMEPGLIDKLKYYNQGESKAEQAKACDPWVEKLRQYADVGAGSKKYLVVGVTVSEDQIKERETLFQEAKGVWVEYQKIEFPLGKTPGLLGLEKEMQDKLSRMPEELRKSRALVAGDLEGEFDRILAYLNKDNGWKSDKSKKPNLAMERDIKPLDQAVQLFAGTVGSDDSKLATLRKKLSLIKETDKRNRAVRAERTFMEPDRYRGKEASNLKAKIKDIVIKKSSKVLRVTLGAVDWKEKRVLEWTDTTKSIVRYRITRSMTAQAAAKSKDGKVYLHGVHLAKDRQSDGTFGALYGHIMWSDWMIEKNLNL